MVLSRIRQINYLRQTHLGRGHGIHASRAAGGTFHPDAYFTQFASSAYTLMRFYAIRINITLAGWGSCEEY